MSKMGLDNRSARPYSHGVELRSEDSTVVIQATWGRTEDAVSTSKYARNILNFTIQSISSTRPTGVKNGNLAVGSTISRLGDALPTSEQVKVDAPCRGLSLIWEVVASTPKVGPITFILPAEDGYIVRGDFVEDMFRSCPFALRAEGFVTPGQHCTVPKHSDGITKGSAHDFLSLLQQTVGVVVASSGTKPKAIDDAFDTRLWWPWTVPTPVKLSRIVMVGEARRESMAQIFYATTRGCGVSVVVLDKPGHWMEDPAGTGAPLREHFVPFDGFTLEELPDRICETIRSLPYEVDGVMSTVEAYLPSVARAAEMLGLPTTPSESYRRATDKFETRRLCPVPTAIKVDSLETFLPTLKNRSEPLTYPLVVKPTHGHGSLGASKVRNETELADALRFAFSSLERQEGLLGLEMGAARVVVETYCEGPEVDVNLVLWDDELLAAEVCDSFPCAADLPTASAATATRAEPGEMGWVGSVYPSGLPRAEIDMLQRDVLAITRQLGIRSGVVHAEARVHNSAVEWHVDAVDGVHSLRPRAAGAANTLPGDGGDDGPKTFLLEVNLRPPGNPDLTASSYVNGMSYYALQLMQITGDAARFRALARGFRDRPLYHYAWTPLRLFAPAAGGRMPRTLGLDAFGLDEYRANEWLLWPAGAVVPPVEKVPHPGLGFLLLRSRDSRREVLEKIAVARHKMCIQLE
ncbi:hypothetical protein GGS24DRAFT_430705 [Hypoxylon argillaceum]|nr:hypothetical protein GGS24DRAFT_430705 [Hypoxylon argillaceum]